MDLPKGLEHARTIIIDVTATLLKAAPLVLLAGLAACATGEPQQTVTPLPQSEPTRVASLTALANITEPIPSTQTATTASAPTSLPSGASIPAPSASPEVAVNTAGENPFEGQRLYVNPYSQAATRVQQLRQEGKEELADLIEVIAREPQGVWLLGENVAETVDREVTNAKGALVTFVSYFIPNRNLTGGGLSVEQFPEGIDAIIEGAAGREIIVVLEPDALGHVPEMNEAEGKQRLELLREAVEKLSQHPNIHVYIEAAKWVEPAAMLDMLTYIGLDKVRGVSLNTSGVAPTRFSVAYANELARDRGRQTYFIFDVGRSGNPDSTEGEDFFNPENAGLGPAPEIDPELEGLDPFAKVDALVWIKPLGELDQPKGDKKEGEFDDVLALRLLANAGRISEEDFTRLTAP
jgi:endoglucanase